MGTTKKPRKAYRPMRSMPMPPAFGTIQSQHTLLALRTRETVDAVISGAVTWDDMMAVDSDLIVAIHLQHIAAARPAEHQVEPEAITAIGAELPRLAMAMRGIKQRHDQTGRVGCTGEERAALLQLAQVMDEMRQAMPRRLWMMAYRAALDRPVITVGEPT